MIFLSSCPEAEAVEAAVTLAAVCVYIYVLVCVFTECRVMWSKNSARKVTSQLCERGLFSSFHRVNLFKLKKRFFFFFSLKKLG